MSKKRGNEDVRATFAKRLKLCRTVKYGEEGKSPFKALQAEGLSAKNYQSYRDWENGNSIPSAPDIVVLAKHFGVSVGYLLGSEDLREEGTDYIAEKTGLSRKAAELLIANKNNTDLLSRILSVNAFYQALECIRKAYIANQDIAKTDIPKEEYIERMKQGRAEFEEALLKWQAEHEIDGIKAYFKLVDNMTFRDYEINVATDYMNRIFKHIVGVE